MSQNLIRTLINARMNAANAAGQILTNPIYINHDNEDPLNPEEIGYNPYLVTKLLPSDTYTDALGGDLITRTGVYHIKVKVPSASNADLSGEIIDNLFSLFPVDTVLSEKDSTGKITFSVQLISPLRQYGGKRIDNWWVVPCSFEYRSDTIK
ncbi:hypothetical protein PMW_134 [Pseudomonas phage phiPMW]|uniref:Uncharacterized protein n=1 Tax=Pseudomonas phage phiPMW TaxID=1815582 RepID=A0A1S5R1I5_9CAUD|nr:tail terminator [Pseudomonas phage phiPMW]ANA49259.1 hypothetical protein PMW_134 [Pseudomonas phage phiPMW]